MIKDIEIRPSLLGKATTLFQMLTIVAALFQFEFVKVLWWSTAFFTILSGLGYIWRGTKVLNESH
jgi:phosphatidylglycerophosphate synthase